jgi:hypothetical protein
MPRTKARRVPVPALTGTSTGTGAAVERADYEVAITLPTPGADAHQAEAWARAAFGAVPAVARLVLLVGWRYVLWLRLGPTRSADHVLGWTIAERRPDRFAMSAPSPLIAAMNVILVDAAGVTWVTAVRYRRLLGRLLWRAAAPLHQLTIPYLLRRAAKALESARPAG